MVTTYAVILIVGIALGTAAGWQGQRAVSAWCVYIGLKALLPALLAAARTRTRNAAVTVVLTAALAVFALHLAGAR